MSAKAAKSSDDSEVQTESEAATPDNDEAGEFRCPECNRRITRGPSGLEYGHDDGLSSGRTERCSRRSEACDSNRDYEPPDYWSGEGFGEIRDESEREGDDD